MDVPGIKKVVEESKKQKHSLDFMRLKKILDELEQQEKSNIITKIEYCRAE